MLRSSFFASGLFIALWGMTFLFVDKLMLNSRPAPGKGQAFRGFFSAVNVKGAQPRIVDPPDWAAFSLMSIGSVTMLYAIALPRRHE